MHKPGRMKIREMHLHWCDLCWACVYLFSTLGVALIALTILATVTGGWTALLWGGGFTMFYGIVFFLVAYFEARSHWKRQQ